MCQKIVLPLIMLFFPAVVFGQAGTNHCNFSALKNQERDAATIQRLETAWSEAYLSGDTGFMSCLLAPDYTEIMHSGELKTLSDELAMAEKNRGKHLTMPDDLPKARVLIHENVAVAYGDSIVKRADGKQESRWYSDTYLWKDGQWHAFFAQQTAAAID